MVKILSILIGLLYAISPYDLAPDMILGIGWIDDLILLGILYWFLFHRDTFPFNGFFRNASRRPEADPEEQKWSAPHKTAYEILGVPSDAPASVVKKAYRELAGKYHPDKVAHLGEEFRVLAEERFKEIQQAYEQITANREKG